MKINLKMDSNHQNKSSKNGNKKKSSSVDKLSINKENPKLKLFMALNNINDEINVKIDSKDNLFINNLNLDCFLNRQSSLPSDRTVSPEKFINNKKYKKNFISPFNTNEDKINPFAKTEESREQKNIRKINKINNNDINSNIKSDQNQFMKYVNSSKNSRRVSKSKISKSDNINDKIDSNSIPSIIYKNKLDIGSDIEDSDIIDKGKKVTLHNLNKEDKIFLKEMESNNALLITDISSLNKKNIVNYNISLSNFNIRKLLNYYTSLVNLKEKEQIELYKLKNEVGEMREAYLKEKKNEIINNKENDIVFDDKYNDKIDIGNLSPTSRYKNDLNFFGHLIIKMNNEIKDV